jgi:hypothetical protein
MVAAYHVSSPPPPKVPGSIVAAVDCKNCAAATVAPAPDDP